jgi:hypothetical protein
MVIKIVGVKIFGVCVEMTKAVVVVSSKPDHLVNTLPALWIRTHHTTALVITPQTLTNFNSHNFNNYPILAYIYIT